MEKSIKKSYVGYFSGFINVKNATINVQYSSEILGFAKKIIGANSSIL